MESNVTEKYVYKISCGSGKTTSEISFLPPVNEISENHDILWGLKKGLVRTHDIELAYSSHWMGSKNDDGVLHGFYLQDTKDNGFIIIPREEHCVWLECVFTPVHKTLNSLGVSEFTIMANGAESSDSKKEAERMLLVLNVKELKVPLSDTVRYVKN